MAHPPLRLLALLLAVALTPLLFKKQPFVITKDSSSIEHMQLDAAKLAPAAGMTASALAPARQGNTIALRDDSGVIVGQLAKIPAETEQITEIKSVSDIDNGAGRELLSIISKY